MAGGPWVLYLADRDVEETDEPNQNHSKSPPNSNLVLCAPCEVCKVESRLLFKLDHWQPFGRGFGHIFSECMCTNGINCVVGVFFIKDHPSVPSEYRLTILAIGHSLKGW